MGIMVDVHLLGVLQKLAEKSVISLQLETSSAIVKDIISELANSLPSEARTILIDSELDYLRLNTLILINDKEVSALNGLNTEVKEGDKIVLVPVSHGG